MANRVLTMEEAKAELALARSRGDYLVQLQKFVESGELGWDFSEIFEAKEPEAIRSSLNNNIDKNGKKLDWPMLKVIVNADKHVMVINMAAYEAVASNNGNSSE